MKNARKVTKVRGPEDYLKSMESDLVFFKQTLETSKNIKFTPNDGVIPSKTSNYVDLEMPIEELGAPEHAVRILKSMCDVHTVGDALCEYVYWNSGCTRKRCAEWVVRTLNQKGFSVNTNNFQIYFEKFFEELLRISFEKRLNQLNSCIKV